MLAILVALTASALPGPLTNYLKGAEGHSRTLRITRAQLAEQEGAVRVALAGLTPTLNIQASYTRNQYDAVLALPNSLLGISAPGATTITIQPYDQLQGVASLNIPIVAPTAIARYAEGRHGVQSAAQAELASELEVQLSVGRAYYQIVAAQGVLSAADRSLKTAEDSLTIAKSKFDAGTANKLTVDRAEVDVARGQQLVADAQYTLGVARRSLETLSGLPVESDLPAVGVPEVPPQGELAYVQAAEAQRPEVKQARELIAQAEAVKDEAWTQLAPSLQGQAQEHLSDYAGFVGREGFWTLGVNLNWNLDPVGTPGAVARAKGQIAENAARLDQALDTVRDDVHTAWLQVVADGAHVAETRAEVASAQEALKLSQEQFGAGTATSLDLSQAQRDAFTAEANAAQSAADLATALLALQKASGTPLLANGD